MLIGLTGMYCAGKNHVAALLERRGFSVLDVDKLGHAALENRKTEVIARFGGGIINEDGTVNRRLLGEIVFGNEDLLTELQNIVHPEANRMTLSWIAARDGGDCVINAALLHKSAAFPLLDCVILISAPWLVRLIRAKRRDRLPLAALVKRFSSQKHFFSHYTAGNADIYRVKNPQITGFGTLAGSGQGNKKLEHRIDAILARLRFNSETV